VSFLFIRSTLFSHSQILKMESETVPSSSSAALVNALIVHSTVSLSSFASAQDSFFEPKKFSEIEAVYALLEVLPAGSVLPCRGRDVLKPRGDAAFGETSLSPFDYGYATVRSLLFSFCSSVISLKPR
jgi:hypothetical protein